MVAKDGFRVLQCDDFMDSSSYGHRTGRQAHLGGLQVAMVTERRCVIDDGETIEVTCFLVKRDKFEFKLNLMHERDKYRYCEFILPEFLYLHKNYVNYISVEKTLD
jgi:hypothetical protein